ncbi:hypothetical protein L218DRAFT_955783 [Marasmius fiardii PR-910]|nr:hypothetical protein L218DRAFT_955783 [Marasmius fiardii PR-910]
MMWEKSLWDPWSTPLLLAIFSCRSVSKNLSWDASPQKGPSVDFCKEYASIWKNTRPRNGSLCLPRRISMYLFAYGDLVAAARL